MGGKTLPNPTEITLSEFENLCILYTEFKQIQEANKTIAPTIYSLEIKLLKKINLIEQKLNSELENALKDGIVHSTRAQGLQAQIKFLNMLSRKIQEYNAKLKKPDKESALDTGSYKDRLNLWQKKDKDNQEKHPPHTRP